MGTGEPKSARTTWLGSFRALVVIGYAALFAWQLAVGKEAGFTMFGARGLRPVLLAGAPWLQILSAAHYHLSPGTQFDLTVLTSSTVIYDAMVLASFAINAALVFRFLAWCDRPRNAVRRSVRASRPESSRKPGLNRGRIALAYAALFAWQFWLGMVTGKEAGFLIYAPLALFPIVFAGFPWFWVLSGAHQYFSPVGSQLDLTVLSAKTLTYHAIVLVSFAINAGLIVWLPGWLDRHGITNRGT